MLIWLLNSVQVNLAAESGDMGVLANHVPSIEQLRPGLVEIIEESGGTKQFFCAYLAVFGDALTVLATADMEDDSVWRLCGCST